MGKIFYIMGKSASGKDRIYSLLEDQRELKLKTLVLYTTRPIRDGEENGKNYYFVSDEKLNEFRKKYNLKNYHQRFPGSFPLWRYRSRFGAVFHRFPDANRDQQNSAR